MNRKINENYIEFLSLRHNFTEYRGAACFLQCPPEITTDYEIIHPGNINFLIGCPVP